MSKQSLCQLLKDISKKPGTLSDKDKEKLDREIIDLQLTMLQIQQAVFTRKERVIIIFEGFDAAGKGGTIRTVTEKLDPRYFKVIPIAAPKKTEQAKHYLYRFWRKIPAPGYITIFDRSWYGRVLVEKVDQLTPRDRIEDAFNEIKEFEETLQRDGIVLIKIFLAVTKDEQLKRFEERLQDPFKMWKITETDINARKHWNKYVSAVDAILEKNDTKTSPWALIPSNSKKYARRDALEVITKKLSPYLKGFEGLAPDKEQKKLLKQLREL
jgi:polyphosphate kinase 2 (PPK2 family)